MDRISTYVAQRQVENHLAARVENLEYALEEIRALSNYPGKGRSTFEDLAEKRRKINKLASLALRKEPEEVRAFDLLEEKR